MTATAQPPPLTALPAWKALAEHYQQMRQRHLRQLFADDPRRGERLTAEAAGLYLDYSKHRVTDPTLGLLLRLAEECGLPRRIDAMFSGEKVNTSENRAALHTALAALGIGPGDEVLVPALSVVMSAAPVVYTGARPVFVVARASRTSSPRPIARHSGRGEVLVM